MERIHPSPTDDHAPLEETVAFVRSLRELAEPPESETAAQHLAAIVDASRVVAQVEGRSPARTRSRPFASRRIHVKLSFPFAGRLRLIAVAVGVLALAGLAGAAYADDLPNPVQGTVAGIANNVGLSIPGRDDDADADEGAVAGTPSPSGPQTRASITPTGSAASLVSTDDETADDDESEPVGAQAKEDDDDQGEDEDDDKAVAPQSVTATDDDNDDQGEDRDDDAPGGTQVTQVEDDGDEAEQPDVEDVDEPADSGGEEPGGGASGDD